MRELLELIAQLEKDLDDATDKLIETCDTDYLAAEHWEHEIERLYRAINNRKDAIIKLLWREYEIDDPRPSVADSGGGDCPC